LVSLSVLLGSQEAFAAFKPDIKFIKFDANRCKIFEIKDFEDVARTVKGGISEITVEPLFNSITTSVVPPSDNTDPDIFLYVKKPRPHEVTLTVCKGPTFDETQQTEFTIEVKDLQTPEKVRKVGVIQSQEKVDPKTNEFSSVFTIDKNKVNCKAVEAGKTIKTTDNVEITPNKDITCIKPDPKKRGFVVSVTGRITDGKPGVVVVPIDPPTLHFLGFIEACIELPDLSLNCPTDIELEVDVAEVFPDPVVAGKHLPIDTTALMLAGIQSSAIWMIPTLAGLAGAGFYLIKFRTNKE